MEDGAGTRQDTMRDIRNIALASAATHGSTTSKIVAAKLLGGRPDLRSRAAEVMLMIQEVVDEVNGMDAADLAQFRPEQKKVRPRNPLPNLPDAVHGEVVTRFPPEPNGYPHIGHAKAAIINYEYARMYGGRLILRMDDTNPAAERLEFYAAIKVDLEWLGIKFDTIKNTSDDMDLLHQKAAELIHRSRAYVCTCDRKKSSENRRAMTSCPCSRLEPEENHSRWIKMRTKYKPGEAVLRYRGDIKSPNTTMRDPVLFRIIDDRHPLLNTKYRTWPSYDLAIAVEDSVDGVTHAFRSKEYEMRNELYHSIQDALDVRKPHIDAFSRLSLRDMPVSKRLIRPLLERGHIAGYDDPRLPTLSGLRRRGITPEAIRKFVLSLGFTKSDTVAPFESLESFNRSVIDPRSVRLHMVSDPVRFSLRGAPADSVRLAALPGSEQTPRTLDCSGDILLESGDVPTVQKDGARLLGLGFVRIASEGVLECAEGGRTAPGIHWVPAGQALDVVLVVAKPPFRGEEFDENSLETTECKVEPYYVDIPDYTMIQFVRFGYARKESARQAIFTHK